MLLQVSALFLSLLLSNITLNEYDGFSILPMIDTYLGCFQFGGVNKASVSIEMQIFLWTEWFYISWVDKYIAAGLLDRMVIIVCVTL